MQGIGEKKNGAWQVAVRVQGAHGPLVVPTVHLNGTAGEELVRQLEAATRDLERALGALRDAAPNARDYYPQSGVAFEVALGQSEARLAKVRAVRDEMAALWNAVQDQLEARAKRG